MDTGRKHHGTGNARDVAGRLMSPNKQRRKTYLFIYNAVL